MSQKKPIIAALESNYNPIDLAKCGITTKSEDYVGITNAINKLYKLDKLELQKLGKNGNDYLLKNHSYDKITNQLIKVINNKKVSLKPVIILGAPRSGTNMLRDILCQHPNLITWDCDEINPIWKYSNYSKSDELKPIDCNDKIQKYIYKIFKISKNNSRTVVKKHVQILKA